MSIPRNMKTLASLREAEYSLPPGSKPIELTCGHIAFYVPPLPVRGEDAFCRECDAWSRRKLLPRVRRAPS